MEEIIQLNSGAKLSPHFTLGEMTKSSSHPEIYNIPSHEAIGGVATSNHLTGCAVDIRVDGLEQLIVYAAILLDISRDWQQDFDELLIERRSASPLGSSKNSHGAIWLHFAVRPSGNRHKVAFINA